MPSTSEKNCFAQNLIRLRREMELTQEKLAEKLYVSGKTVSKWERGLGYPEISQLVNLSHFFGVSIDRLLLEDRFGIAVAGNLLTDQVKTIDAYPEKQMLSSISSVSRAVGGCVPNTAIDLAVMDPSLSVAAVGKIGKDEAGAYVIGELKKHHVDTRFVSYSDSSATSFSDVMSVESTGERTFFHYRGANAEFSPSDVDLSALSCKMLHIGYILLLDSFDREDAEYGTVMARFLAEAQKAGIRTSIDAVSSNDGKFGKMIFPALRYTDNAIMNEIEGCSAAGISPRDGRGRLLPDRVRKAMQVLLDGGVRERVILHCPEAGFCLNKSGAFTVVPSLSLPAGYIKGSVGAGDAFCAGCLLGIYRGDTDEEILSVASGAAACNLAAKDSVSGMRTLAEIKKMLASMPKQEMPVFES